MNLLSERLIFGTGRLHHLFDFRKRQILLLSALEAGFHKFDTAPSYGNGINEYELGIALKGKRHNCEINTKYGIPVPIYSRNARYFFHFYKLFDKVIGNSTRAYKIRKFDKNELTLSVHQSLKRLQTDYIDTLFIHEPLFFLDNTLLEEINLTSEKLKQEGKIRWIGVAGPWESIKKISSLKNFDVIQTKYDNIAEVDHSNFRLIVYNVHRNYEKTNKKEDFNSFIKRILELDKKIELIVSTISAGKLYKLKDVFR